MGQPDPEGSSNRAKHGLRSREGGQGIRQEAVCHVGKALLEDGVLGAIHLQNEQGMSKKLFGALAWHRNRSWVFPRGALDGKVRLLPLAGHRITVPDMGRRHRNRRRKVFDRVCNPKVQVTRKRLQNAQTSTVTARSDPCAV